ncbi:MAG: hypothetical protein U5K37_11815 [Natrialbaceae archaeon]|nr:hypothetical protein [Natrialbaceae archaeon]
MTGLAAVENMAALAFTDFWHATDSYPALSWQDTDPLFEVTIESTNTPVTEEETLTVTANVTNWGADGSQLVTLTDTDFADTQRDSTALSLTSGEFNDSILLEWDTQRRGRWRGQRDRCE